MDISPLIASALEDRGNAVMVIGNPERGEGADIRTANATFARVVGRAPGTLLGARLGSLQPVVHDPAQWSTFTAAVRAGAPFRLDMRLHVAELESWFRLDLATKTDPLSGARFGIVIGRDMTEVFRRAAEDSGSQRLLAAVFLRVAMPIVIVAANGAIRMANPAFQELLEYDAKELVGKNVGALTAPEYNQRAQALRERQLRDGGAYEMRLETFTKRGARVAVTLRSVLLHDADLRLRLVTLTPERPALAHTAVIEPTAGPVASANAGRFVGQVQAISLSAFREAFSDVWESIASRAMLIAENIIKRRIGPADVVTRESDGFFIWFDSPDEERNAAILAGTAREIRLRFLTEFSEQIASHVSALMVGEHAWPGDGSAAQAATPATLTDHATAARERVARDAAALLATLRQTSEVDIRPVRDRDDVARPMALIDFTPNIRARLVSLASHLPTAAGGDVERLRLDLALRHLAGQRGKGQAVVALAWSALTDPDRRRSVETSLAGLDTGARANLIVAVTDVPPLSGAKRWAEVVGVLRRLGGVALTLTLGEGESPGPLAAMVSTWPITLLVLDGEQPGSVHPDGYFDLIGLARGRNIPVLALCPAQGRRDWRELGATLFA